jgi:hypothetical protein
LVGAGLTDDAEALRVLSKDMTRDELRWLAEAFARLFADEFAARYPSVEVAAELIRQRAIRAAIEDRRTAR